jgi:16S rRNA G527 N7-methylase RsmG
MNKIETFAEMVLSTASHKVDKKFILKNHVEHALVLSKFKASKVLDIGSGCGWTAIIYAIENPDSVVHFLERNEYQNEFIENACNMLNIYNCQRWTKKQNYDLVINKMLGNWKELNFIIQNHVEGPVDVVALDNAHTPSWVEPCGYTVLGNAGNVNVVGAAL